MQRLVIAFAPDAQVPAHVHPSTPSWSGDETLAVLDGDLTVLWHELDGSQTGWRWHAAGDLALILGGVGHSVTAGPAGAVVLELKPGSRPDTDRVWL